MDEGYISDEESDIGFLLSFVPDWALIVPEGLDPTFYGTLSYEGDLVVKERVDKIRTKEYGVEKDS